MILYEPMIRSFSSLEDASAARDAVVAAGIDRDVVELRVLEDEAGPVEGNFYVGNGRTQYGDEAGAVKGGADVPYDKNFGSVVHRGSCLLVIGVVNDAGRQAAAAALAPFDTASPADPADPAART
jgi:hypothetical protein